MSIQFKRGTKTRINILASNRGLLPGEPLLITDEDRFAIATSPSTYTAFAKQSEAGGGGSSVSDSIHGATSKTTPEDADELGLTDSTESWGLKKLTFANLKAWIAGLFVSRTSAQIDGNLNIAGSARRITGDFSNATVSNRVLFQTKTLDAGTALSAIPNGTGLFSQFSAYSKSDPDNSSVGNFSATATDIRLVSTLTGTGAYLPLAFHAGGAERLRISPANGNVLAISGALGYGVGAGGTVVQATSKSTAVTLNKPSGRITMFNDPSNFPTQSAIAAGAVVSFNLINSSIGEDDLVVVQPRGGGTGYEYQAWVSYRDVGMCAINVRNNSAGSRSDSIGIQFNVFKGAAS